MKCLMVNQAGFAEDMVLVDLICYYLSRIVESGINFFD